MAPNPTAEKGWPPGRYWLTFSRPWITPQQQQRDLAFWIEGYYTRERRHSTIVYLSPIDYEQRFIAARTLTTVTP